MNGVMGKVFEIRGCNLVPDNVYSMRIRIKDKRIVLRDLTNYKEYVIMFRDWKKMGYKEYYT